MTALVESSFLINSETGKTTFSSISDLAFVMEMVPHTLTNFDVSCSWLLGSQFSAPHLHVLAWRNPGDRMEDNYCTGGRRDEPSVSQWHFSLLFRERKALHSGGQHILSRFPVGLYNYSCSDSSSLSLHMHTLDSHPVILGSCVHPCLMASSQRGHKVGTSGALHFYNEWVLNLYEKIEKKEERWRSETLRVLWQKKSPVCPVLHPQNRQETGSIIRPSQWNEEFHIDVMVARRDEDAAAVMGPLHLRFRGYNVRRRDRILSGCESTTLKFLGTRTGETQTFPLHFQPLPQLSVHNSWTDAGVIRGRHTS